MNDSQLNHRVNIAMYDDERETLIHWEIGRLSICRGGIGPECPERS